MFSTSIKFSNSKYTSEGIGETKHLVPKFKRSNILNTVTTRGFRKCTAYPVATHKNININTGISDMSNEKLEPGLTSQLSSHLTAELEAFGWRSMVTVPINEKILLLHHGFNSVSCGIFSKKGDNDLRLKTLDGVWEGNKLMYQSVYTAWQPLPKIM